MHMRDAVNGIGGARAPEPDRATGDCRAATFRGLGLSIDGTPLVRDLNLTLDPTGITMIMGPNGAGKSLLLKLLHGLIAPSSGEVSWGGQPLSNELRRAQSMVFQKPVVLRRSVAANVDFVLKARGIRDASRRDALLAHVDLLEHAHQPARLLSGGEQQRLALARALATEPKVMLMDEPTASLDPASVLKIEEIVQDAQRRGTKILFVTHDLGQAERLADDIVFMHKGRLHEYGAAELFLSRPETEEARNFLQGRIVV
ncbi:ATP-binding cassette domain-containing protein [Roseovarius sp. EGI FJ00037]|uniref:ATP-binding cassette domain-containing protein n=1 Tax=Roseovarius salincola TaxID=2978479 RepID=UPI0022A8A67C|nr:ATP-binding cassette domain-containing protein [Roseovarius sp. EGI FJ00037]MCZ0814170.1 ATP-binding cassette domain-containing protein [Roseovarius sp. EGI FJ00037]